MPKYNSTQSGLLIPATIQSDGTALVDGADTSVNVIVGKYNNVQPGDRVAVSRIQSQVMVVGSLDDPVSYYEEWLPASVPSSASGTYSAFSGGSQIALKGSFPSAVTAASGKWTCPVSGLYSLCLGAYAGANTGTATNRILIVFMQGSVGGASLARYEYDGPGYWGTAYSLEHSMNAGDVLYPGYYASGGAAAKAIFPTNLSYRLIEAA